MKIAFDVDGVVLRSIEAILDHINRVTWRNLTPDDLSMWDLEPLGIAVETLRDAVHHMYSLPDIPHYEGAVDVLSQIYQETGQPLLFITGRSAPGTARRQLEALPWPSSVPEMIITGGNRDKREYLAQTRARFIVEDDPAFLETYLQMGYGVGLMLQPWNRRAKASVTARFGGWDDLRDWFMKQRHTI